MAYIVRGGSAPDLVFTRTGGDVALGRIVAYAPGSGETAAFDAGSANTLGANSTTVTTTEITVANDNTLLVMAECLADNTTASRARATDPDEFVWRERADSNTATGADTGLAVSDAFKLSSGATGTLTYTAGASSRHVCAVGAFYTTGGSLPKVEKLVQGTSTFGTTNLTTSSFTPDASTLLIVVAEVVEAGATAPTVSGGSLSWTEIATAYDSSFDPVAVNGRIIAWWAAVGGSPSSMTVTVDASGTPSHVSHAAVFQVTGADNSSPIGGTATNTHLTDTQTMTLSATPAATSVVFEVSATIDENATNNIGHARAADSWIEILDFSNATEQMAMCVQIRYGDTSTTVAWSDLLEGTTVATDDLTASIAFEIKAGTTNVNLTAPKLSSASTLRTPTVSLGAQTASPPKISSASVLRTPSLRLQVGAPKISSASVLRTPTISEVFTVSPAKLASASVLRAHTTNLVFTVSPAKLASASVLYDATVDVGGETVTVEPPKLDSVSALRTPATQLQVAAPRITSASILRAHTVTLTATVSPPKIASTSLLRTPTVSLQITAPKLASVGVLRAPSVALTFTVSPGKISSASALRTPTIDVVAGAVTVQPPRLASSGVLRTPTISEVFTVSPAKLASVSALRAPVVSASFTISPPKKTSNSTLRTPTVSATLSLVAPKLTSVSALRVPSIGIVATVTVPKIASASVLRTPTLQLSVAAPRLESVGLLRVPSLTLVFAVSPPLLGSASVLRDHTVSTFQLAVTLERGDRIITAPAREKTITAPGRLRKFDSSGRDPIVAPGKSRTIVSDGNEPLT